LLERLYGKQKLTGQDLYKSIVSKMRSNRRNEGNKPHTMRTHERDSRQITNESFGQVAILIGLKGTRNVRDTTIVRNDQTNRRNRMQIKMTSRPVGTRLIYEGQFIILRPGRP
jgi:hypothetical protein